MNSDVGTLRLVFSHPVRHYPLKPTELRLILIMRTRIQSRAVFALVTLRQINTRAFVFSYSFNQVFLLFANGSWFVCFVDLNYREPI